MEKSKNYIVWDLETTGFVPTTCKIIEIGVMRIVNDEVVESKNWLLNHGIEVPPHITEITTITTEMVNGGVSPDVAMKDFLENFIEGSTMNLTHNGFRFDIPFLLGSMSQEQLLKYKDVLEIGCMDSAVLYKAKALKLSQNPKETFRDFATRVLNIRAKGVKYNVGHCCNELKIDTSSSQFHRALGDTYLTNEIYKKLI